MWELMLTRERQLVYPELSYKLTGIFFKVHNKLGRFCREKQYTDWLEVILKDESVRYGREVDLFSVENVGPRGNRADFVIERLIIVDLKAKRFVTKDDYYQMRRYLRAANMKLGLIVNFRSSCLKPKRVLNSEYSHHSHVD